MDGQQAIGTVVATLVIAWAVHAAYQTIVHKKPLPFPSSNLLGLPKINVLPDGFGYGQIIPILIGIGAVYLIFHLPPSEVKELGWNHLPQILSCWAVGAIVVAFGGFNNAKALQWIMAGMVAVLIIIIPFGVWVTSPSTVQENKVIAQECTKSNPCTTATGTDGMIRKVSVPRMQLVCFSPTFFEKKGLLGYTTSNQGEECTDEKSSLGKCDQTVFDTFWFDPRETDLPKYWFVPNGTKEC